MSRSERLGEVFRRLDDGPGTSNADDAMSQMHRTLDEVEDELSGIPRNPNPGLESNGRMYPPQADRTVRSPDGSITTTSKGHTTDFGPDGSITVRNRANGDVVYRRGGRG